MPRAKKTVVCPYGGAGVGGKWMFWSMYHLLDGAKRFSELRRIMPQATRQTLVAQLRGLEQAGAVSRTVSGHVPPRVEYSLTRLGAECEPILRQLHGWGEWYCGRVGRDVDWLVRLGGRWKVWVIHGVSDGPRRFGELQRLLAPISKQVLARELRELDDLGLVCRLPPTSNAPRGAYGLTATGRESLPVFRQLHAWGRWADTELGVAFDWPVDTPPEPLRRTFTAGVVPSERPPESTAAEGRSLGPERHERSRVSLSGSGSGWMVSPRTSRPATPPDATGARLSGRRDRP